MGNLFKKEFLLGIGVGCIISAFLVSIFGVGTMSDEEVIARASKLGMVKQEMPWNSNSNPPTGTTQAPATNTTEKSGESQDVNQSQTASQSQTSKNSAGTTDSSENKPAVTTAPASSETPAPSAAQAQSATTAPPVTTTITITNRMGSESVARLLEEKGVIKDQYEFLKVVDSHNAQRRFQTGTFKVTVGGDMEEILEILIGKKR